MKIIRIQLRQIHLDIHQVTREKFLITRSKRQYCKRELKLKHRTTTENVDLNETNEPVVKKRRETIKNLNSKIEEANNFFTQLNKKLEDRENEIKKFETSHFKWTVSEVGKKPNSNPTSEIQNLLAGDSRNNTRTIPVTFHDFPVLIDTDGETEEGDDLQLDEQSNDDHHLSLSKKRRRSKSRSRSRSRSKDRNRKKKKSKTRESDDSRKDRLVNKRRRRNYIKKNPVVQQMVKRMVGTASPTGDSAQKQS